jgi:hypothetical protein
MIRIKAKRNNFRRAGIAHPDKWTEYPDDAFTPEQIAALKAETMLIVQVVAPEPPEPDAGDDGSEDSTPPQVSGLSPQPSETPQVSKRKGRKG